MECALKLSMFFFVFVAIIYFLFFVFFFKPVGLLCNRVFFRWCARRFLGEAPVFCSGHLARNSMSILKTWRSGWP